MPIGAKEIREATKVDPVLSQVLKYTLEGWPRELNQTQSELRPYFNHKEHLSVEQGCILLGYRVIVPTMFHERLLRELHNDHPGICKMKHWLGAICGGHLLIRTLKQRLSHVQYVVLFRIHHNLPHCIHRSGHHESGRDCILILHRKE